MRLINLAEPRKIDIVVRIVFYLSIGILIATFFLKNTLPPKEKIAQELYQDPIQRKTYQSAFKVNVAGSDYQVDPLYTYQLYGLVVSQHDATAWWDYYHRKWGDQLNLKDVCVIWGDNLKDDTYRRMRFRNGSWTCYVSVNAATADEDWSKFNMASLSNNHLLSNKSEINQVLRKTHVGDQIYLKGYLASYQREGTSFSRSTSTSRTDEGNGACETVYLTEFKVVKPANTFWWFLYKLSKYLVAILFFLVVFLHVKAPLGG